MSYETVIEEVTVTRAGKTAVFEICAEPDQPQRAYIKGISHYYDIPTFNAGLAKADNFTRRQVADVFTAEPSEVRGR